MRARPAAPASPIVARLKADFPDLPDALARAAKYIINYPHSATTLSIGRLAEVTESGQASIIRLCRSLGFAGFREFRVALAAQLGATAPTPQASGTAAGLDRLCADMINTLSATSDLLDRRALRAAAERIVERGRANVYGAGVSGLAGGILAAKLLRAGIWAQAFTDFNMAIEVIGPVSRDAVAIAISDSGTTPETVRALRAARAAGAATVAITSRPAGPIAAHADLLLRTAPLEQKLADGVTTSVPAQMLVIETLVGLVAAAAGRRRSGSGGAEKSRGRRRRAARPA